jgi:hypothetical protein
LGRATIHKLADRRLNGSTLLNRPLRADLIQQFDGLFDETHDSAPSKTCQELTAHVASNDDDDEHDEQRRATQRHLQHVRAPASGTLI